MQSEARSVEHYQDEKHLKEINNKNHLNDGQNYIKEQDNVSLYEEKVIVEAMQIKDEAMDKAYVKTYLVIVDIMLVPVVVYQVTT